MTSSPLVTVIALCYNHAPYVIDCLDSIDAQTIQDFELVVADDFSNDESADLIESWLQQHRRAEHFIRHTANVGVCRTLNEALSVASGKYLSLIATDDFWAHDKIERQLRHAESCEDDVAVVYSDAIRVDVAGNRIAGDFIDKAWPGLVPPSGRIFQVLVDRNFIPAMATLVRRSALVAVGGYDERLSFEDYDMWLRLSARWRFSFLPGTVAAYRIVPTSLARSLFSRPSADRSYSMFLIREKWLDSDLLTPPQRQSWSEEYFAAAYSLYTLGDPRARACLWAAARRNPRARKLLLAVTAAIGVRHERVQHWAGRLRN